MTHRHHNGRVWHTATAAQGLSEYLMSVALVGFVAVGGLLTVNGNLLDAFKPVKGYLASVAPQTTSQLQYGLLKPQAVSPSAAVLQPANTDRSMADAAQLENIQTLLSQISPGNLPEVSGTSSDIGVFDSAATRLLEQVRALEALQKTQSLDISELIIRAKTLAMTQYLYAAMGQVSQIASQSNISQLDAWNQIRYKQEDIVDQLSTELLAANPNDAYAAEVQDLVRASADGFGWIDPNPNNLLGVATNLVSSKKGEYVTVYQGIETLIQSLSLDTQQSAVVTTQGGGIVQQDSLADGQADNTKDAADALSQCQQATCSP